MLADEDAYFSLATLQHSYWADNFGWNAKLLPGVYKCVRGFHKLHNMIDEFETFEITGVQGHFGILFHCGNFNKDSEGCVLLGLHRSDDMIVESKKAFQSFMDYVNGLDEFELTVI